MMHRLASLPAESKSWIQTQKNRQNNGLFKESSGSGCSVPWLLFYQFPSNFYCSYFCELSPQQSTSLWGVVAQALTHHHRRGFGWPRIMAVTKAKVVPPQQSTGSGVAAHSEGTANERKARGKASTINSKGDRSPSPAAASSGPPEGQSPTTAIQQTLAVLALTRDLSSSLSEASLPQPSKHQRKVRAFRLQSTGVVSILVVLLCHMTFFFPSLESGLFAVCVDTSCLHNCILRSSHFFSVTFLLDCLLELVRARACAVLAGKFTNSTLRHWVV